MCKIAPKTKTIIMIGMTASSLYWCMILMMPSAVYAQVIDAIKPPIIVARRTRINFIRERRPSIAPTSTPEAMNGIQTNTISPQNPHLLIISRFSFAVYSTVERMSPRSFVCSIRPPNPSCRATAAMRSSLFPLRSTRPAPERSASVEIWLRAFTINSCEVRMSWLRSEM